MSNDGMTKEVIEVVIAKIAQEMGRELTEEEKSTITKQATQSRALKSRAEPTPREKAQARWGVLPLEVVLKIDRQSQQQALETAQGDLAHAETGETCRSVAELANSQANEHRKAQQEWKALAEQAWVRVRELRDAA
jgi:hypothetical protein